MSDLQHDSIEENTSRELEVAESATSAAPKESFLRGVVKWFNDAKGFGFIEHTSGRDVFVHYSVIQCEGFKTLKDGEEVNYQLSEGDKGLHAARVVRVAPPKKDSKKEATAPKLESGTVKVVAKPVAEMIEIERIGTESSEPASNANPATAAKLSVEQ